MNALDNWRHEKQSAWLYRVLAECEAGSARAALFRELADDAERQAAIWQRKLATDGGRVPDEFVPGPRARLVAALTRRYGPRALRPVLAAMKVRGMSLYTKPAGHAMPTRVAEVGARHRTTAAGGNLRAAVFGANDGLVSNASLMFGVAGAGTDAGTVLLAGVAGLLAGALSMAAGEYVSVRSQRELFEYQIGLERDELAQYPDEEAAELTLIYEARGVPRPEAERLAAQLIARPEQALDTLAREELGLNPDQLGAPGSAAAFSFVSFAAGALVPLAPLLLLPAPAAIWGSVAATGAALFALGAAISLFTGRGALAGGARMLAIGGGAGLIAYLAGSLLGVSLG